MSQVIPVSVEWLGLREEADAPARSEELARRAARLARQPVVVHDLGSGTGSMMRWLTSFLPTPQTWVLHDWNHALLDHAARQADAGSDPVDVRTSVRDVAALEGADLADATLVTTSALLDVLTREEVERIVRACVAARVPAFFSLTVTGRVDLEPADPGDRVFESAFNDHQRRTTDGRRLLGPDAVPAVIELFRAAGWRVRQVDTPWRLDPAQAPLIDEWLEGWVVAAAEERPALQEWADEYLRARRAQLRAGILRVEVRHRDVLAWPP